MHKRLLVLLAACALALNVAPSVAAEKKAAAKSSGAGGYLYRYTNEKGVTVIDSAIPPEFASKGYDILTRGGQLVQKVAPVASDGVLDEAEAKKKREETALMSRRDGELRKLYSSPQDAERLRNRQVEAITLKIDYAKGQLLQVTNKRKVELEQAAKLERKGTPVPPAMKDTITRLNTQATELDAQIKTLEGDKERLRAEFEPVIERLKVLYPDKAAAATPATPAAPGTAPAVPATPAKTTKP